ncbi:MAG: hypothetical protein HY823_03660 [Acidobacteria bacterium]|nr:hypothetical protein [Acidobacteriota bacterium]
MARTSLRWFAAALLGLSLPLGAQNPEGPDGLEPPFRVAVAPYFPQPIASLSLTTLFAGGNSQNGNMFDVQATKNLVITSFDIHLDPYYSPTPIEVYYRVGTSAGFETNPGAWSLLGSATVTSAGYGVPTPLPIGGLTLNAGQVYGLYVTSTTPIGYGVMRYTNGTTDYANSDLTIFHGFGKMYPFSSTFSPRIWNGTIYYRYAVSYDTSCLDDQGRSRVCFNSQSGDYKWEVLSGPRAGTFFTGKALVRTMLGRTYLTTPAGSSLNLSLTVDGGARTARGTLLSGADFMSQLMDSNTANNPPAACLKPGGTAALSTTD